MYNVIIHPIPNFNGATDEVWEWIRNFIAQIMMDAIAYRRWEIRAPWSNDKTTIT